ncbi:MAG: PAS domain-containing protein, partial [bacterium]|nr:PAS domain-containing protein [bacterium]
NEGLEKIDWETGVFTHYKKGREPFSLSHNRVFAICEDRAGMIWAGTWGGGLNRLDPKTGNFKHYRNDPGKPGTLRDDHISSLLVDGAGVLWVGTKSGGLNQFQPGTGTFTAFSEGPDNTPGITGMRVTSIFEDRFGRLWVGTDNGLNLFDRKTGTFSHFRHDPQKDTGLSNDSISTIHADKSGTLWVGTYGGGLNKLPDPKTGIFQHYWKTREKKPNRPGNLQDRLPSNIINGILEDEKDNLWISTNHGLSKFNPAKESFRNYDIRDGLQSNEFHGGVCFKAKNGQMFFGGINGFNAFYPARLKIRSVPPPIVFTKFQVNGEPHEGESMEETRDIALDYRINYKNDSFAFEFAALDFSVPGKNKYEYKSEKLQSGWVRRDAKNRMVTFSNVSPGTYVFQVRGSNHEEVWNTTGASLKITILPPFWQTWWFRALVALLLLSVLFIGYRKRTRRLRQKLEEKERVQEILTQSNYEMEKVRDIAVIRNAENEILLTAISTIFVAVDSDGYIFQWNKSSEKFFKISREQALKHPFAYLLNDYIPEEKLKEIVRKGLKEQRPSKDITVNVDLGHGNGGNKLLLASISPVIDRTGKKLGFLLMAEDITNRKEEEDMQNLSKKLEALGQMASGIAHEIKTPLQYIGHNSRFVSDSFKDVMQVFETIEEGLREMEKSDRPGVAKLIKDQMVRNDMDYIMEEIPKASSQIINGVEKVSEIIQSMTEYTYPGRGFKEKCDINELLKSTLVVVQNSIKRRADIHLNLDKDLPHVPCYPGELCQVFLNVLVNAGDAVEEKGEWGNISIYTGCEEENVLISITDTGVGIAENHRENIFTPFFTTKEVGKGTGQGLSLAHNVITENHNGKLEFTSKAGEGTTFYIRLPREIKGEH